MSNGNDKIRIFVLEDNELTRGAVIDLLSRVEDFDVVGEAGSGELAVENAIWLEPDILVADIGLPGINGIDAIRMIRRSDPSIRAIMLTAHDSDDDLFQSFRAGAEGYILKSGLTKRRLELAIKSVDDGSVWLDPLIAKRVLTAAISDDGTHDAPYVAPLSTEERSVLEQVANGSPQCQDGVCNIEPGFLENLKRFAGGSNGGEPALR